MKRHGRSEAGLTYPQVVLLLGLYVLASVLIFLFGVWVGRDAAERRLLQEERMVRAPVVLATPSPAREDRPEEAVDRAFYERLRQKAAERLAQAPPVEPRQEAMTTAPAPTLAAPPLTPTRADFVWLPTPTSVLVRPTPRPTSTLRPRPTATPAMRGSEGGDAWADAGWTVQVTATTDATEARALVQRLRSRGYDAYLVQAPSREGTTWYRVRVGRFASRDEARQWEQRLKTEAGMPGAFVTPR